MNGLVCSIFRADGIDCSMRGGSSCNIHVLLACDEESSALGFDVPTCHVSGSLPVVVLRLRTVAGVSYVRAVPIELTDGAHSMMGGCFIWSSDSRFPSAYPVPLHDRVER